MTNPDRTPAALRLDAALDGLATTFRGMTAHPDENNCECHWGSAEELAQLKVPGTVLDPDLLRRTWQAIDWSDHASVLRRILPQFATALVQDRAESVFALEAAGRAFALGHWQQWPAQQAEAVREFLEAWWVRTLVTPEPAVPAHEVLVLTAEAAGTVTPWLHIWEATTGPVADHHLAEAAAEWEYELLRDELPWHAWENGEEMRAGLTDWLVRHALGRLRACGASEELLHRIRLLGVTGPARWEDPHWPDRPY
ncbi:hypothetical protein ACIPSA_25925 [Streptomyces sp. NPDC086549]|uniref:hypothetical protein n=1 Tax=Streptomyces sp. NPDC086549 TaxID=3365752 RepID=UPI003821A4BB